MTRCRTEPRTTLNQLGAAQTAFLFRCCRQTSTPLGVASSCSTRRLWAAFLIPGGGITLAAGEGTVSIGPERSPTAERLATAGALVRGIVRGGDNRAPWTGRVRPSGSDEHPDCDGCTLARLRAPVRGDDRRRRSEDEARLRRHTRGADSLLRGRRGRATAADARHRLIAPVLALDAAAGEALPRVRLRQSGCWGFR